MEKDTTKKKAVFMITPKRTKPEPIADAPETKAPAADDKESGKPTVK